MVSTHSPIFKHSSCADLVRLTTGFLVKLEEEEELVLKTLKYFSLTHYQCSTNGLQLSCSGITAPQLHKSISATINKTQIYSLDVSGGLLPTIYASTLSNFSALQSFYATDCRLELLQEDAFSDLPLLYDVDLSNNLLSSFNSQPFPKENSLKILNLASNLLEDLSQFDIGHFPKLQVLNLTNNLLQFLPADILQTLQLPNKFYLLADNNPWNCSHPDWSQLLEGKLLQAFCSNQTFDYAPQRGLFQERLDGTGPACEAPNCYKCSFNFCLLWLFCGIWIGIIVGNLPKLRILLCVKPTTYTDGTTQCGTCK